MVSKLAGVIGSSFISESLSKLEGTIVADRQQRKGAYCSSRVSSNINLVVTLVHRSHPNFHPLPVVTLLGIMLSR